MASPLDVVHRTTKRALSGEDAHVETASALRGLDWKLAGARPDGVPHSIFQLVNHMVYWQHWLVRWLDGKNPRQPRRAAAGWPGKSSPANRREWERAVRNLGDALDALDRRSRQVDLLSKRGKWTPLELLHIVGSHTSYHIGQVALLRHMLRAWPPPLYQAARELAAEIRDGSWRHVRDLKRKPVPDCVEIIDELRRRCRGFSMEEYKRAVAIALFDGR